METIKWLWAMEHLPRKIATIIINLFVSNFFVFSAQQEFIISRPLRLHSFLICHNEHQNL